MSECLQTKIKIHETISEFMICQQQFFSMKKNTQGDARNSSAKGSQDYLTNTESFFDLFIPHKIANVDSLQYMFISGSCDKMCYIFSLFCFRKMHESGLLLELTWIILIVFHVTVVYHSNSDFLRFISFFSSECFVVHFSAF